MKHTNCILMLVAAVMFSCGEKKNFGSPVEQTHIARVDLMPDFPQPYKILDWRQRAVDLDNYLFDFNSLFPAGSVIWLDGADGFGIYTAIHDSRGGKDANNGKFYEGLVSFPAVLGAGLMGIDKTNQNAVNFVTLLQNHFNTKGIKNSEGGNAWNLITNVPNGGWEDWWYEVFPNVLYYYVCDVFPNVERADSLQRLIAEQFYRADSVLNGNYNYSYFDYGKMEGKISNIPLQQDAAGGHGYVLLAAYKKFGNEKYLAGAKSAISALNSQKESRFYEILLPVGTYTAARLNAEYGADYNIDKMLQWVFDGCKSESGRYGWGIICDKWGDYDVSGLQGSITDGGGYAFLMNSIKTAIPLVPLVKYQPQYAAAIGKYMLNNANACRLFFPNEIDDEHQYLPEMKNITNGTVAYEGLRKTTFDRNDNRFVKTDNYPSLQNASPVALGDGPAWTPTNPKESMFSLYSTTPIGVFGAMIDTTNIRGILRINCNTTDFYAERPYNVYLYYNPFDSDREVEYNFPKNQNFREAGGHIDLFDIISKKYLAKHVKTNKKIIVPAKTAVLVYELPAGAKIKNKEGKLFVNDIVISYK